ncbi:dinucleotide-binding enzyme [Mycobacterium sp. CBMA247]|nr:dinucleotide-binding enzyme [Mycolicibacterium sp. CBMA 329]MUL88585.1 dinucleotide-binding enzyme [Mycolicibacterium sp. CBMA 331]MUM00075.1 dinucleotide-binding enzyme [Mycolicibacterium sp. CBMA 334]MUM29188.1 dinucleotide-binding enzyme [Mycolicibacterium sp. CBMA 295]MUM40232.1 dinucleotide-binding enzyme [Mycolicibacterium sp. CBMA 247]MUM44649.1 dinucleotide-binding enzyme [Mycolicibacterium sp. CBMA 294]
MRIAVIGAGSVGRTLGKAWQQQGHDVTYGVPKPDDGKYAPLGSTVATNAQAAADAEVIVLCTPWDATRQALTACGDIGGKVIIDCTNPLSADAAALTVGHTTSGAEHVAQWASGGRVCKALNQIGASMMDAPQLRGVPVMFVCGDDDAAKKITLSLVHELGFEAVDAGDLTAARLLEPFGLLWIHLALRRGLGRNWGFGILRG